jgi:hypothetical protein
LVSAEVPGDETATGEEGGSRMTLLELIRLRLEEAEAEPGAPGQLIDAVCALSDYVECKDALARGDVRRWCWLGAYLTKLGTARLRSEHDPDCRRLAITAAHQAVADFDAFIASGQPRDEGDDA